MEGRQLDEAEKSAVFHILQRRKSILDFPTAWRSASFVFDDSGRYAIFFAILQYQAGPCGVFAPVQAYMFRDLLHGDVAMEAAEDRNEVRGSALAAALGSILWKVRRKTEDKKESSSVSLVVVQGEHGNFLSEKGIWKIFKPETEKATVETIKTHYNQIVSGGALPFLCSVILTKGIENLKRECGSQLIAEDGQCFQELVNLLLTGKACGNNFDDNSSKRSFYGAGIDEKQEIGFLINTREADKACGKFYNDPIEPIWVVYTPGHYSVLYSAHHDKRNGRTHEGLMYHFPGMSCAYITIYEVIFAKGTLSSTGEETPSLQGNEALQGESPETDISPGGTNPDKSLSSDGKNPEQAVILRRWRGARIRSSKKFNERVNP